MSKPADNPNRHLPKKEADLFKGIVKNFEMKQYKKAIKQADTILKKFPNHGETLAMKGLVLNSMSKSKSEEAHALAKRGLMNDMRSHVCWHVLGLLHRSDLNYGEAIKAYKQALRIDKENLQILRDLSILQFQMRDMKGYAVTRHTLLTLKPNVKMNWLSFALAKHLTGDHRGAIAVIDAYLGTLTEGSPELERGLESGDLAMYKNTLLAEIPDNWQEALNHLDTCKKVVVDRGGWLFARAKYQLKLGLFDHAKESFTSLFERCETEDYRNHAGYMCSLLQLESDTCDEALSLSGTGTVATMMPLSEEQRNTLLNAYEGDLAMRFPKSPAIKRIQLTLVDEDRLKEMVDHYCRAGVRKGVPSLGSDLSALFLVERNGRYHRAEDPVDVKLNPRFKMIVELVDAYVSSLSESSKFPGDETEEPPSTLLWVWFLRAGLHELAGELTEGLALLDRCLEHTPTAVDVYERKARLLKAAGDIKMAVECIDKGRDLDRQDRYINNQTTKYMLQAGMNDTALERISLFTRHEGSPQQNLFDMQCIWYELELAKSLERQQMWGRSLKNYFAVVKHFRDFREDQWDFHPYCVRRSALRVHTEMLHWEDSLRERAEFGQAAEGIIRIYLYIHDHPMTSKEEKEPDYSKMSAAERKKAKAIQRKRKKAAEKKAAQAAAKQAMQAAEREKAKNASANSAENGSKKKQGAQPVVVDKDPDGKELLEKNALEEAKKLSAILATNAPQRISTWILQYDVSIRRQKALLALQALFKARAIDPENPELLTRIVDFLLKADTIGGGNATVLEVLGEERPNLVDGKTVGEFVVSVAERTKQDPMSSLPWRTAVLTSLVLTKKATIAEAIKLVLDGGLGGTGVTVDSCANTLRTLGDLGDEATDALKEWKSIVAERFPLATEFK